MAMTSLRPLVARVNAMRGGVTRNISILTAAPTITSNPKLQDDVEHAVHMVKQHDPAGYIPGRLLPTTDMSVTYYAVRSFWVETGLRFGSTAKVDLNAPPIEHIEWWQQGIDHLYNNTEKQPEDWNHPTLRLLQQVIAQHNLSKCHFDDILMGRRRDVDLKQYPTLDSLIEHVVLSCGSLSELVLESGDVKNSAKAYKVAKLVGVTHGLTNALRTSIPVMSTTGKLVVPQDLCEKYGVKSPRYLLSALGQGDVECRAAFQNAIRDIANEARSYLEQARSLRDEVLEEPDGEKAVAVFIPGLASEIFLDRLEEANFDLTDRDLRNVGMMEHVRCVSRMIAAYYQKRY